MNSCFLANNSNYILRIIISALLGGLIGLERESIKRPAGFRTHILVSLGATVAMITNIKMIAALPNSIITPARFGAAVISGIGFLGAGTIIKEGKTVKGLTTAASLWVTACIGLCVGLGELRLSIITTLIVFITLEIFPYIQKSFSKYNYIEYSVITNNKNNEIHKVNELLESMDITIIHSNSYVENLNFVVTYELKANKSISKKDIFNKISNISNITSCQL